MANLNLNKAIIGGRLTADAELKTTTSGKMVTSFKVAVNRVKDGTDFIPAIAWNKTAETVTKYFKKGDSIVIEGSIQIREWKDKDGKTRYATEIIADRVYFVDSKSDKQSESKPNEPAANPYIPNTDFEEITDDDELPF